MRQSKVIDQLSYVVALLTFGITVILFIIFSGEFIWSLIAGVINAALIWITYIMLRILILALRKDK